jgi:hypothetical protein
LALRSRAGFDDEVDLVLTAFCSQVVHGCRNRLRVRLNRHRDERLEEMPEKCAVVRDHCRAVVADEKLITGPSQ